MQHLDNEKEILSEAPDFDRQYEILNEEKKYLRKRRRWYILASSILVLIVLVFLVSYSVLYAYRPYSGWDVKDGKEVNVDTDGDGKPDTNIVDENKQDTSTNTSSNNNDDTKQNKKIKPNYNIDYQKDLRGFFNLDIYGDQSRIFNPINQMDETNTYCILNCDGDNDGWADYNIDFNGDGIADINIVLDPKNSTTCNLNCDINNDTIPDINIDTNNDGIADINIAKDGSNKPSTNIDYKSSRTPMFNIEENGEIINPVNDATNGKKCSSNCDIDGDGFPDYNIKLPNSDTILNELVKKGSSSVDYTYSKDSDWKCVKQDNITTCDYPKVNNNTYINIDVDGDGTPDVNISYDGGKTVENKVNNKTKYNNKDIVLNKDTNNDGFPDYNIDIDGDGTPDLNITDGKIDKCIKNCDTNNDGVADYLVQIGDSDNLFSIGNINIDYDYDTVYDVNIDTNYDLYPDLNIDLDGDIVPDINIDYDHDGIADYNIDTNGDGIPDVNLDPYGVGKCVFNCETEYNDVIYPVNSGDECNTNCDTDSDGWPDKYIDLDHDGVCDLNCDGIDDTNRDYYKDNEFKDYNIGFDVNDKDSKEVTVANELSIKAENIDAGWSQNYVMTITNDTAYAIDYKILWNNVSNTFVSDHLVYYLTRSNTAYLDSQIFPISDIILKDSLTIRAKTTIKFVLNAELLNMSYNQIEDASKTFSGKLKIEVKK